MASQLTLNNSLAWNIPTVVKNTKETKSTWTQGESTRAVSGCIAFGPTYCSVVVDGKA